MNPTKKDLSYEDVLLKLGPTGRWQWQLLTLYTVQLSIILAATSSFIFLLGTPEYYCVPEGEAVSETNFMLSTDNYHENGRFNSSSECEVHQSRYYSHFKDKLTLSTEGRVPCSNWLFISNKFFGKTAVTNWQLVCSNESWKASVVSVFEMGVLFGVIFSGICADTYGRRFAALLLLSVAVVAGMGCVFVNGFFMFLLLRFFLGFGIMGAKTVTFVLVSENLIPETRAYFVGIVQCVSSGVAVLYVGMAYVLRSNFRYYMFFQAVICLVFYVGCYRLLPESPRWLLTAGRMDEAEKGLVDIAKTNGRSIEDTEKMTLLAHLVYKNIHAANVEETADRRNIFANLIVWLKKLVSSVNSKELRFRTICICFVWFSISLVSFGAAYYVSNLALGPYLAESFNRGFLLFLSPVIYKSINSIGRKPVVTFLLLVTTVTTLWQLSIQNTSSLDWLPFTLLTCTRVCISLTFGLLYFITSELFPTDIRATAISCGSVCARIAAMIAPFIIDILSPMYPTLPTLIFGAASGTAGLVVLLLPETRKALLQDTVMQATQEYGGE